MVMTPLDSRMRWLPWALGLFLVLCGYAAIYLVYRARNGGESDFEGGRHLLVPCGTRSERWLAAILAPAIAIDRRVTGIDVAYYPPPGRHHYGVK